MNTNDFQPLEYNPDTCWEFVFKHQKEIFLEYLKVEKSNWNEDDFSIDCLDDQTLFKDFGYRVIEELTEATTDIVHPDHFLEEIVDALNFLVELMLIYGWNETNLPEWKSVREDQPALLFPKILTLVKDDITGGMFKQLLQSTTYEVVEAIGLCNNTLKNRLWKNQHYLVDLYVFEPRLKNIWTIFNNYINSLGISEKLLFEVWSTKYQVNLFRRESLY
jgi:hypothetical protein